MLSEKYEGVSSPNLFIVGAGKAGTSALYSYLGSHPEVFMSPVKEPNFFCRDLRFRTRRISQKAYAHLFDNGRFTAYRGEASVSYMLSAQAASEIKAYAPDARIIIMVRNPVEVMQARHAQNVVCGDEDILDFEAALDAEAARRSGYRIPSQTTVVEWLFYREWVNYSEQIRRYCDKFPPDQIFIGVYDDFKDCPELFYESVLSFLRLPNHLPADFEPVNLRRTIRSRRFHRMLSDNHPPFSPTFKHMIPSRKARRSLHKLLMKLNSKRAGREELPSQLKARLQSELAPEVLRLGNLLGRNLTHWITSIKQ